MNIEICMFVGERDWDFVRSYVPLNRCEDTCGLVAIDTEKNETVGALIFDNFLHNSAQGTIIAKNSMVFRSHFLEEGMNFLFEHCGKDYLYVFIAETNIPSRRLCKRLDFTEQMRIKEGYSEGVDFIVLELNKRDCNYYQNKLKEVA